MSSDADVWYDGAAGPLVRLYAITGGRTETSKTDFTLSAIVQRVASAEPDEDMSPEKSTIVRLAERPVSVSEIAARLGLPLGAVRVLLGDLRSAGQITVPCIRDSADQPTMTQLERLLAGLNSL